MVHKDYDNLLSIQTKNIGIHSKQSSIYNPYEATPYSILHALFNEYTLRREDHFVDFGCGKGRILFLVHYLFNCAVTGIEMDVHLYKKAIKNKHSYVKKNNIETHNIYIEQDFAETYRVKISDNIFYFFNPFSGGIFQKVVKNIVDSVKKYTRQVDIILYYPLAEYVDYMKTQTYFDFYKEVKVPGLYNINKNERFLIFRLKG